MKARQEGLMGLGKSRSVALGISSLRCLLDIQVEISGRQLAMRVQFGEVVQDKDINWRVI